MKSAYCFGAVALVVAAGILSASPPKSSIDYYNSRCNNYLTFNGLEKTLKCAKNIQREKQELEMGEVLTAVAKPEAANEKKPALYSDKFAGAKTIHEHFAWNLAKATDSLMDGFNEKTPAERRKTVELSDALRDFAEYEIEGDGHSLIGADNGKVIVKLIEKFGAEKAKDLVSGAVDKGIQNPNGEALALKKHGVFDKFREIALKSAGQAVDDYLSTEEKAKNPDVALNDKQAAIPANNVPLVSQETVLAK